MVQVTEAFTNLTNLKVGIQFADEEDFSDVETALWEKTLVLADIDAAGDRYYFGGIPAINKRYMRLYYTVTGSTPGAGKITATLVPELQTNGY
jgi:hypothetical protein